MDGLQDSPVFRSLEQGREEDRQLDTEDQEVSRDSAIFIRDAPPLLVFPRMCLVFIFDGIGLLHREFPFQIDGREPIEE